MVEQLRDPIFWELFWNNGGRILLTLLMVDVMLLLILEIVNGHFKNRRNRSSLPGRQARRANTGPFRGRSVDGVETLASYKKRISTRPHSGGARFATSKENILQSDEDGTRRTDGTTVDSVSGVIKPVRLNKDKLSGTAEREGSLSHSLNEVQIT